MGNRVEQIRECVKTCSAKVIRDGDYDKHEIDANLRYVPDFPSEGVLFLDKKRTFEICARRGIALVGWRRGSKGRLSLGVIGEAG